MVTVSVTGHSNTNKHACTFAYFTLAKIASGVHECAQAFIEG